MKLVEQFFRILAPASCLRCDEEGELLCAWCRVEALPGMTERCYKCNALSPNAATCRTCRRKSPIRHLWVRTDYTEVARQLVHTMKFAYTKEAALYLATEIATCLPALPADTIVTYVPAATSHVRQRGFDHAQTIAKELARRLNLPYLPTLARQGQQRQVGVGRQQRLHQMEGAFRLRGQVAASRVLIIDDVLTTGATIESAALVLVRAGAKVVDGVVFARAK